MKRKYDMAAKLTIQMVLEIMANRHSWTINQSLSYCSKLRLYETLSDSTTTFWMDNPHDIADLLDKELSGQKLEPADFFK
ncbi:hypothetical protein FACS189444_6320 [Spirochaetia bacterium]|nr:hypothetical protein FACS189444_6320 [Spirochaetia bacterium]